MITDVLLEAGEVNIFLDRTEYGLLIFSYLSDPVLKISEKVDDEYEYLKLTDDILKTIQFSECEELKKARQIIKRIRTRKLYRFVDEFLIPAGMERHLTKVSILYCTKHSSCYH
jgi:hypothetical protein